MVAWVLAALLTQLAGQVARGLPAVVGVAAAVAQVVQATVAPLVTVVLLVEVVEVVAGTQRLVRRAVQLLLAQL
jgi:hypothetical protein